MIGISVDFYDGNAYVGGITGYSSDTAVINNCINNCSYISTVEPKLAVDAEYGSMTSNQTGVVTDSYYVVFKDESLEFDHTQGKAYYFNDNIDGLMSLTEFDEKIWTVDYYGYNIILKYFYN